MQLAPLATLKPPKIFSYMEDFLLRTLPFPAWTVKSYYKKLYDAFSSAASATLDEAECFGIKREEACHNLVFMAGFNAYGGFKSQFPLLMKWVGSAGEGLHKQLCDEIRAVVKEEGGWLHSRAPIMPTDSGLGLGLVIPGASDAMRRSTGQ